VLASGYDPRSYPWRTDVRPFTFEEYRRLYSALERGRSYASLDRILRCLWPRQSGPEVPLAHSDPWLTFRLPDADDASVFFRNPPAVRAALVRAAVPELEALRRLPRLFTATERCAYEWSRLQHDSNVAETDQRTRCFSMAQFCALLRRVGSGFEAPARCFVKHVGGLAIPPGAYLLKEREREETEARVCGYMGRQIGGEAHGVHAVLVRF
jgi:hypothetical protein